MMDLFASDSLPSLAFLAVLLDLALKGTLMLALAGLLTTLLKNVSASARHLIWCLALCSVLLLPVMTMTLPAWRVPVLPALPFSHDTVESMGGEAVPEQPATSAISVDVPMADGATAPDGVREEAGSTALPPAYESFLGVFAGLYDAARATPWPVWLLVIWAGGVAVVLFRFLIGAAGVGWLAYRARPIQDPAWIRLSGEVQHRLGLRRRVRLLRSVRTAMPMTWGVRRPVVLLPIGADDWSPARRWCVLTHEMAHVRRWDCLTQMLSQLACAANWFNPMAWVAARRMRHEREVACDDYVLGGDVVRPSEYAAHLLEIARTTRTTLVAPLGAVAMARPSHLESRVLSILDATRRRGAPGRLSTAGTVVLAVGIVLPLAALRPADRETASPSPAFHRVVTGQGTAYQWAGRIDAGKTITIRGVRGHVQATPSSDRAARVTALPRDEAFSGAVRVIEEDGNVVICLPDSDAPDACAADTRRDEATDDQVRVDFVVLIPRGVHFSGQTLAGNVTALGLQSDVEAATVDGDIFVEAAGRVRAYAVAGNVRLQTAAYAQATTRDGDIHARLGRTDWTGPLPFNSLNGDVTVELPENAHTDIDLHVEAEGRLQSMIHLRRQARQEGDHFRGTVGRGGRLLAIHTKEGNVTITHSGHQAARPLKNFDVPRPDAAPSIRQDRPVYRADARPTPPRIYAETQAEVAVQPEQRVMPGPPDPDLDARLARVRRQVGRLGATLNGDLFETAARTLNELDLGVAVNKRDLVELVQIIDGAETRYAKQLTWLGFEDVTREELLLARLVGVNTGYVQAVRKAGYCPSLKELVALKVAGVDRQYLREMASEGYGSRELPVKALVALRASGVDKAVIHEMEEHGIQAPTVEEMVEFTHERGSVPK